MPLVKGKDLTPDEAIAQNRCPECGIDLTKVNPIAELHSHWKTPPPLDSRGDEPRRRQAMLLKFIADHNVRTSNMPKPAPAAAAPLP